MQAKRGRKGRGSEDGAESRMENGDCVQLRAGLGTLENSKAQPRNSRRAEPLGQWTHRQRYSMRVQHGRMGLRGGTE